jgi:diguanylate cyclase (GGDEF)-like protein
MDRNGRPTEDELVARAAADTDRSAAEADQDLSDSDQSLSDSDQGLAERDQQQSDADQASSDRDQVASDRDLAAHSGSGGDLEAAHAASEADRARTTAERESSTTLRSASMFERVALAERRDKLAALRDENAAFRDRVAELAMGRPSLEGIQAEAAENRRRAAEDRERAADDRKRAAEDREHALDALERAQLDDLTGFYRPGLGVAILQREIDRARRSEDSLTFAYCDVDNLKHLNDTAGHDAGDDLLRDLAKAMRSRLRSYDPVVRMGGDEFVCALPGADLDEATRIVGDVQRALAAARPDASASFGLSPLGSGDSVETMLKRSDDRMRQSKAADPG